MQDAWRLANKVATMTALVLGLLCILGMVFSAQLVALLAPGFDPEKAALTARLTRIMFPFILLVSLAALVMGMLNAKNLLWHAGDGIELFQYWFDHRRGGLGILDRSALRSARPDRPGVCDGDRRRAAAGRAAALARAPRLSLPPGYALARSGRQGHLAVDGSGGDRREHHASQCPGQFHVCIDAWATAPFFGWRSHSG